MPKLNDTSPDLLNTPNPGTKPAVPAAAPSPLTPHPSTLLWLIRHAEVEEAYQGVFGGRIDMGLSPRGHRQAAALAEYLHGKTFDALYASPMKRVAQTLEPALLNGIPRPIILPGLREVDFGDWTGLKWNQIQPKFGVSAFAWLDQLDRNGIANAESAQGLRSRLEACVRQILDTRPGQQVAIACHGGVIRMLLAILLEWPLPKMAALEIDYASVTRVAMLPRGAQVQLLNYAPWREGV